MYQWGAVKTGGSGGDEWLYGTKNVKLSEVDCLPHGEWKPKKHRIQLCLSADWNVDSRKIGGPIAGGLGTFFLVGMRVESLTQVPKNTRVTTTKVGKWGLLHMGKK